MPEDLTRRFQDQRKVFAQLHLQNVIHDSREVAPPSARKAFDFGTVLIGCPSLQAIQNHMQRHVEGARSFLTVANKVVNLTDKSSAPPDGSDKNSYPFFLLGSVVLDILEESKAAQPHLWTPEE